MFSTSRGRLMQFGAAISAQEIVNEGEKFTSLYASGCVPGTCGVNFTAAKLHMGREHGLALNHHAELLGWGLGANGELLTDPLKLISRSRIQWNNIHSGIQGALEPGERGIDVVAGGDTSFMLTSHNRVLAWGRIADAYGMRLGVIGDDRLLSDRESAGLFETREVRLPTPHADWRKRDTQMAPSAHENPDPLNTQSLLVPEGVALFVSSNAATALLTSMGRLFTWGEIPERLCRAGVPYGYRGLAGQVMNLPSVHQAYTSYYSLAAFQRKYGIANSSLPSPPPDGVSKLPEIRPPPSQGYTFSPEYRLNRTERAWRFNITHVVVVRAAPDPLEQVVFSVHGLIAHSRGNVMLGCGQAESLQVPGSPPKVPAVLSFPGWDDMINTHGTVRSMSVAENVLVFRTAHGRAYTAALSPRAESKLLGRPITSLELTHRLAEIDLGFLPGEGLTALDCDADYCMSISNMNRLLSWGASASGQRGVRFSGLYQVEARDSGLTPAEIQPAEAGCAIGPGHRRDVNHTVGSGVTWESDPLWGEWEELIQRKPALLQPTRNVPHKPYTACGAQARSVCGLGWCGNQRGSTLDGITVGSWPPSLTSQNTTAELHSSGFRRTQSCSASTMGSDCETGNQPLFPELPVQLTGAGLSLFLVTSHRLVVWGQSSLSQLAPMEETTDPAVDSPETAPLTAALHPNESVVFVDGRSTIVAAKTSEHRVFTFGQASLGQLCRGRQVDRSSGLIHYFNRYASPPDPEAFTTLPIYGEPDAIGVGIISMLIHTNNNSLLSCGHGEEAAKRPWLLARNTTAATYAAAAPVDGWPPSDWDIDDQVVDVHAASSNNAVRTAKGRLYTWGPGNGAVGRSGEPMVPGRADLRLLKATGDRLYDMCTYESSIWLIGTSRVYAPSGMEDPHFAYLEDLDRALTGRKIIACSHSVSHSLLLTSEGVVLGRGLNLYSQLGAPNQFFFQLGETQLVDTTRFRAVLVAAGFLHSVVIAVPRPVVRHICGSTAGTVSNDGRTIALHYDGFDWNEYTTRQVLLTRNESINGSAGNFPAQYMCVSTDFDGLAGAVQCRFDTAVGIPLPAQSGWMHPSDGRTYCPLLPETDMPVPGKYTLRVAYDMRRDGWSSSTPWWSDGDSVVFELTGCPAGMSYDVKSGACILCPVHHYKPYGGVSCITCPVGTCFNSSVIAALSEGQAQTDVGSCSCCEKTGFEPINKPVDEAATANDHNRTIVFPRCSCLAGAGQVSVRECDVVRSTSAGGKRGCDDGRTLQDLLYDPMLPGLDLLAGVDFGFCQTCTNGTAPMRTSSVEVKCTVCPKGFHQPHEGQTTCIPCDAGYYSDSVGATSCTACPPGTFAAMSGEPKCSPCPAGSHSDGAAARCEPCPVGVICPLVDGATQRNAEACIQGGHYCGAGALEGASECPVRTYCQGGRPLLCPAGYACSEVGMDQPTACGLGAFSRPGAQSCLPCRHDAARCEQGVLDVDAGWWAHWQSVQGMVTSDGNISSSSSSNSSTELVQAATSLRLDATACLLPQACPRQTLSFHETGDKASNNTAGRNEMEPWNSTLLAMLDKSGSVSELLTITMDDSVLRSACAPQYTGELCVRCAGGNHRRMNWLCVECEESLVADILLTGVMVLLRVLLVIGVVQRLQSSSTSPIPKRWTSGWVEASIGWVHGGAVLMLVHRLPLLVEFPVWDQAVDVLVGVTASPFITHVAACGLFSSTNTFTGALLGVMFQLVVEAIVILLWQRKDLPDGYQRPQPEDYGVRRKQIRKQMHIRGQARAAWQWRLECCLSALSTTTLGFSSLLLLAVEGVVSVAVPTWDPVQGVLILETTQRLWMAQSDGRINVAGLIVSVVLIAVAFVVWGWLALALLCPERLQLLPSTAEGRNLQDAVGSVLQHKQLPTAPVGCLSGCLQSVVLRGSGAPTIPVHLWLLALLVAARHVWFMLAVTEVMIWLWLLHNVAMDYATSNTVLGGSELDSPSPSSDQQTSQGLWPAVHRTGVAVRKRLQVVRGRRASYTPPYSRRQALVRAWLLVAGAAVTMSMRATVYFTMAPKVEVCWYGVCEGALVSLLSVALFVLAIMVALVLSCRLPATASGLIICGGKRKRGR